MKVFRIEKDGIGPFNYDKNKLSAHCHQSIQDYLSFIRKDLDNYPPPIMDGQMRLYDLNDFEGLFYGCLSIEDINHWFSPNFQALLYKNGFQLNTYTKDKDFIDILKGRRQVAIISNIKVKEELEKRFSYQILW